MKHTLLILSLLLVLPLSQAAEAILLCGQTQATVNPFPFGSGYGADRFFQSPVSDDGAVLLIAPDPEKTAQNKEEFYFAVYHCPRQNGVFGTPQTLFAGYFAIPEIGLEFTWPNWQIASDAAFSKCLTVREEDGGTTLNPVYLRYLSLPVRGDVQIPNVQIPRHVKLAVNAGGNLAMTWGGSSTPTLYDIDSEGSTPKTNLNLSNLDVKLVMGKKEYTVKFAFDDADQVALSNNSELFFAATGTADIGEKAGLGTDQRGLFMLNLNTLTARFVGNAGSARNHLSQLALSGDGSTLAYRFSSSWLRLARRNVGSDTYSVSTLVLSNVLNPQISADGRYVVFESTATDLTSESDGTRQIYRYDIKREDYQLISSINGIPADNTCHSPAVSPNGRMITFVSNATNLVPGLDGSQRQVFLADAGEEQLETRFGGELYEGEELTWERASELGITSVAETDQGIWYKNSEEPVSAGVLLQETDFPLHFVANDGVFNRASVSLLSDLYQYEFMVLLDGMKETISLQKGWQLLSCPFVPDAQSANYLLENTTIFAWNPQKPSFLCLRQAELLQQAGIGVFVYSDSAQSIEISGTRVVDQNTTPQPISGWQLRGPVGDGDLTNDFSGEFLFQLINSKVIRPANSTIPSWSAAWLFYPAQ